MGYIVYFICIVMSYVVQHKIDMYFAYICTYVHMYMYVRILYYYVVLSCIVCYSATYVLYVYTIDTICTRYEGVILCNMYIHTYV